MSEVEVGIILDPSTPTPIAWYGPARMCVVGEWRGATLMVERRLPERAGDPYPDGSWAGVPWSNAADGPRQPSSPYGEHDPPRIYWLFDASCRVRVIPAAGQPAPSLVASLSDPAEA